MHYAKLFSCILDSSIWEMDDEARLLWITMMAMADVEGVVRAIPSALARRARISLEGCERALQSFTSPDEHSRSIHQEGRRLLKIEGGWLLVNFDRYRRMLSAETTRERNRVRAAESRKNKASTSKSQKVRQVEVEVEVETKEDQIEPPTGGSPPAPPPARARVRDIEPLFPRGPRPFPEACDHSRQTCEEIGCPGPEPKEEAPDPFVPPAWAVDAAEGVSMGTGKRFADVAAIWRVFFAWAEKEGKAPDRLQWRYWLAKETVYTGRKRGSPPVGEMSDETRRLVEKAGAS